MAIHRIIIEDSQGNKAKLSISADTLQAAIDKVKDYNPEMNCKVCGDQQWKNI